MAVDERPFERPSARYHNSDLYPYTYGSLPTRIDSKGCQHQPFCSSTEDLKRLNGSFESINEMRDILITEGYLPEPKQWNEQLQSRRELICVTE